MTVTTAFPATLLKSHLEVDAADRFAARGLCELSVRGPCVACTAVRSGRWVECSCVGSGAKCWLWKGFRRTDAVTWTRVAVASDESADGYPSGCIWNAQGQLLPAAPACHQPRAWDTYARVRCVASQVRHQSDRLDTVRRSGALGLAFGAPMAHTG